VDGQRRLERAVDRAVALGLLFGHSQWLAWLAPPPPLPGRPHEGRARAPAGPEVSRPAGGGGPRGGGGLRRGGGRRAGGPGGRRATATRWPSPPPSAWRPSLPDVATRWPASALESRGPAARARRLASRRDAGRASIGEVPRRRPPSPGAGRPPLRSVPRASGR